jgi:hypothetical protein
MASEENPIKLIPVKEQPPDNPFFVREYTTTVEGGYAVVKIPAPGGKVSPEDAEDLLDWLGLIARHLERDMKRGEQESTQERQGPANGSPVTADESNTS